LNDEKHDEILPQGDDEVTIQELNYPCTKSRFTIKRMMTIERYPAPKLKWAMEDIRDQSCVGFSQFRSVSIDF